MKEVYKNLWVGNEEDYEYRVKNQSGWAVVHACKEPYHRAALGYTGRGAPKNHSEYLFALRGNRLILNMVDADDPSYIPREIIDRALSFINENLERGLKVLVHCNQGFSRSPGIALLYLAKIGKFPKQSYVEAKQSFRSVYPDYAPAGGINGFCELNWKKYNLGAS